MNSPIDAITQSMGERSGQLRDTLRPAPPHRKRRKEWWEEMGIVWPNEAVENVDPLEQIIQALIQRG